MGFVDDVAEWLIGEAIENEGVQEAVETMYGMVGNAGQQSILDTAMGNFEQWAQAVGDGEGDSLDADTLGISESAFEGTSEIWATGEDIVYSTTNDEERPEGDSDDGDDEGSWLSRLFS